MDYEPGGREAFNSFLEPAAKATPCLGGGGLCLGPCQAVLALPGGGSAQGRESVHGGLRPGWPELGKKQQAGVLGL